MRKISCYLYPNRIELLADLASFNVEYTNVYQRNVKIYKGVDNTIEFDIKNADQKRLELVTAPSAVPPTVAAVTDIVLNVMDAQGNALPNSPYAVTPTSVKGIASATITSDDLTDLDDQFLRFSVTGIKGTETVILYADTRFGMAGTIELISDGMPIPKKEQVFTTYTGEIDLDGNVINHFSVIPAKFYEAVKTEQLSFRIKVTGFIGTIWLEGTTNNTISVNSFLHATRLRSQTFDVATTTTVYFSNVNVDDFAYFRVYFKGDNPLTPTGKVVSVTVS